MALAPGTPLGPYEILGPLGAGGMGEVYRARDTRLDHDVEVLHESPLWKTAGSWLPGDKALLFDEQDPETSEDIKLLPLEGKREPRVLLRTPFFEGEPEVSRDGRWMAYVSRETGRDEVCVREMSGSRQQWQISTAGGRVPRWRADGHVMSAAIDLAPVFRAAPPRRTGHESLERRIQRHPELDGDPEGPLAPPC